MSHRMLYKAPGSFKTDAGAVEYIVVVDADVEAHEAAGWHRSPVDAVAAAAPKVEEPKADLSDLTDTPVEQPRKKR